MIPRIKRLMVPSQVALPLRYLLGDVGGHRFADRDAQGAINVRPNALVNWAHTRSFSSHACIQLQLCITYVLRTYLLSGIDKPEKNDSPVGVGHPPPQREGKGQFAVQLGPFDEAEERFQWL